uniref:Gelsolin-like domain-containing protein n=1 Tax=Ditylenchus dipsaci TaxID=166011 RepID=A0A915CLX7_9BILA
MTIDPKLKGIGQTRGLQIWRIKKFALEDVPKEQYGNFYAGDSYIVLHTKNKGEWDVHFWLGKDTTQDEMGTAAIKTVELDDSLGGLPVQYRELQDHESPLFLSYFKDGIKYLHGGNATGFNHVTDPYDNFKPILFHCKGKRNVRCTQVKCVKESLNLGDVFILDLGLNLYVWCPPESGRLERIKGMTQAKSIRDAERAGRPKIHVLDQDWNKNDTFWKHFGGKDKAAFIKAPHAAGKDEDYWREHRDAVTLWRVSDATGQLKVTEVSKGGLNINDLDTKDAFILDAVHGGTFVWVGKECTLAERKKAMDFGTQYLEQKKRPVYSQLIRVLEGAESSNFAQWFSNWSTQRKTVSFKPKLFQCSNESGKLSIEEIEDFYQEDLDGDDVMILDGLNVIYVWVGNGANAKEKEAAKETANKYLATDSVPRHKKASIDVIYQGKEPPPFKKFFPAWNDKFFVDDRSANGCGRSGLFAKRRQSGGLATSSPKIKHPTIKAKGKGGKEKAKNVHSVPIYAVNSYEPDITTFRDHSQHSRRSSIDFPTAVLHAARRASEGRRLSATMEEGDGQSAASSCQLTASPAFSEQFLDVEVPNGSSPFPGARRRACDVGDYKSCALVMTKMKEDKANTNSPQ